MISRVYNITAPMVDLKVRPRAGKWITLCVSLIYSICDTTMDNIELVAKVPKGYSGPSSSMTLKIKGQDDREQ